MDVWDALGLKTPGIVACTGAGGKTSLLLSLAACGRLRKQAVLLTATTKMYYSQVADYRPVFCNQLAEGLTRVSNLLKTPGTATWFTCRENNKVIGLPAGWLNHLADRLPAYILVEADGAQEKFLKAPASHEPVIPRRTMITVGVLNLKALGRPLTGDIVHRPHLVMRLLGKQPHALLDWQDIAVLACHRQGIFQHAQGKKILLLAGGDGLPACIPEQIIQHISAASTAISHCVVTEGYGLNMQPLYSYSLDSH